MQVLRNAILIALAFDATEEEANAAHALIDRVIGGGGVDPSILVHAQVNGVTGETVNAAAHIPAQPSVTPAATAAPQANTTVAANSQLDAAGFPWDERIHSSNKKLNTQGLWWGKRGVTPAQKAQVEAELRATLGAAPVTAQPAAAPVATVQAPVAAVTPPMPGGNVPPMPGAAQPDPAYTALVQFIAQHTQSAANPGALFSDDYIKQILTHYGIADGSLQNLAHRLDVVKPVHDWLLSVVNGTAGQ